MLICGDAKVSTGCWRLMDCAGTDAHRNESHNIGADTYALPLAA